MIVILASRYDAVARRLADRWAAHDAVVLTVDDLAAPGWRWTGGAGIPTGTMGLRGTAVPFDRIRGVITRLPHVHEHELPFTHEDDRAYVAQEMSAFLLAWLSSLPCPVINRPSASSLTGVAWRREQWLHRAALVGLPVVPFRRTPDASAGRAPPRPAIRTAVVGDRVLEAPDPTLAARSRALAREAAADLLAVEYVLVEQRWRVHAADPLVDLDNAAVAAAVLEYLR